jgi:hypothetical protein
VLVVGFADHEHQKNDLFRGLRPRNPRWRIRQRYHSFAALHAPSG